MGLPPKLSGVIFNNELTCIMHVYKRNQLSIKKSSECNEYIHIYTHAYVYIPVCVCIYIYMTHMGMSRARDAGERGGVIDMDGGDCWATRYSKVVVSLMCVCVAHSCVWHYPIDKLRWSLGYMTLERSNKCNVTHSYV